MKKQLSSGDLVALEGPAIDQVTGGLVGFDADPVPALRLPGRPLPIPPYPPIFGIPIPKEGPIVPLDRL
jgi:hypothetical protein